jgi:hypothetical protein
MAEGLRLETVDGGMLALLKRLMADKRLDDFNLVGGTALALQLGHRKSVDLDLFRTTEFDSGQLAEHLKQQYNAEFTRQNKNGVFGYIGTVKFDMLTDPTPLIDKLEKIEGIRMLSIRDIGAMKLNAIYDDGGRLKDFADMYALLEKHPFNTYLDYALKKFPEVNPVMLRKSLLYHADVNFKNKVEYIEKPVEWRAIVDRLREAFHNPAKVFKQNNKLKHDQRIDKPRRLRRGHRPG